ncbi:MAG TPA: ATP-binding cassette domain-containing protein [Parafilimonas sp.]|nr:ATP-binding cassette domain-containing protein [Parafilimonas sp.]
MKIILTNAGKRFSREWIFRNLNYEFLSAKSYAITGANGSGKSTLLQVISSSLILNDGSIDWQLNEKPLKPENVHQDISFTAPYFELVEEMTAKEFLLFHAQFKNFINNFSVEEILQKAELSNASNKQIRFYSSGMKQRLKLAQAIFSDVPCVLLDEPCTNLDEGGFNLYYNWIGSFCKNRLLIVSSNDVNEYKFCDEQLNIQDFKK